MNAPRLERTLRKSTRARGFSLIELMIVVVITGILAAIAIPTFGGYIQRSRTSEATSFLSVIKLRQEAYRSEFGSYLPYSAGGSIVSSPGSFTAANFVPAYAGLRGHEGVFPSNNPSFNQLGAKPDGMVARFGYAWAAGTPAGAAGAVGLATDWDMSPADHYFVAQARSDLDGDGTPCTYEVTNFTKGIWYSPAKGWE